MMSFCRICRTEDNLKYTLKELRRINKKLDNNPKDLLYAVTITPTGNICFDCEELLHNFNRQDSDVEVDCGVIAKREDSPVIVDDDELLYNLFFNKQNITKYKISHQSSDHKFIQQPLGINHDTDIIEVVNSSRESTPVYKENANLTSAGVGKTQHNMLSTAIIEQRPETEEEEIVFRKVDDTEIIKENNNQNRKVLRTCKQLANCNIKIVASLSLLSSDSEPEAFEPLKKTSAEFNSFQPMTYSCSTCDLKFNDGSELQSHKITHNSAICPVCNASFALKQRLVQHMRKKHRSYTGEVLKERPKCAQDSAMTIRLRYLQRYTFYECQLCGQIDTVFKEHKHHIITMHAAESKSLKDPMMKELNCPICKIMCGTQHVNLCAHLRAAHRDTHSPYLKQVFHVHPLGWSTERQRDIEATSKVFQFLSRKSRYFECKCCLHLSPGYFNHWKHLNKNNCIATLKEKQEQLSNGKIMDSNKSINDVHVTSKTEASNANETCISNAETEPPRKFRKLSACPIKARAKRRLLSKKATINKPFKETALVRIKVKQRLVQFPTLEYNCKYCSQKFKGFRALNMHQIKTHLIEENILCRDCSTLNCKSKEWVFRTSHKRSPHFRHFKCKNGSIPDENSNTSYGCFHPPAPIEEPVETPPALLSTSIHKNYNEDYNWLKELMQFTRRVKNSAEAKIYQCEYCTQLFTDHRKLSLHEQQHISNEDTKIIKCITNNSH